MKVTVPQLIETMEELGNNGAKIATVITRTYPEMRKTLNPFVVGTLVRIAHRAIILGANYQYLVNKQRIAEGKEPTFIAEELWKGNGKKHGRYTVYHPGSDDVTPGTLYFAYKPSVSDPEHLPHVIRSGYYHNGKEVLGDDLKHLKTFLKVSGNPPKQQLNKQIFWQTLKLENIVALCYGRVYDLDHSVPATIEFCPVRFN